MIRPSLLALSALLLLLVGGPQRVAAYPKLLLDDKKCAVPLQEGQKIMGQPVVQGKGQTVMVMRGETMLKSGDPYTPGEKLTISFPTSNGKFVFESLGGEFGGGKCGARRMLPDDKGVAEFTAPADGLDVMLWAGYASKKGAVTVTESFLLKGTTAGARAAPIPGMTPPPVAAATAAAATAPAPPAAKQQQQGNLRG